MQEGNSFEKTYTPPLDMTGHCLFSRRKKAERFAFRISKELSSFSGKLSPPAKRHEQSQSYSAKHAVQQTTSGISIVALKRRGGNISNTSKHPQI